MPILPNPKHERFAQGLVEGLSADAAYKAAGYKPSRGNAARLRANDSIVKRVAELQVRVAEKVLVDRVWVITALIENAEIALGRRKTKRSIKLKDSEMPAIEVEEYDRDAAAANAALKLLGQIPEVALFKEATTQIDVNATINNAPQPTGADHLEEITRRFSKPVLIADNTNPPKKAVA